ncbi:hypothetical protein EUX98_g2082 [Antrodiella citrinella]|uniref:t-SNARE coiled-coil homology domain-containing protein n=1 Tax=Antrodiella citrinella TaxID=2447956 RepID=A0A4S4MZW2_9APHY|nr:hypothetical protein EUX98_g2082 [Antrodiella citrinella]
MSRFTPARTSSPVRRQPPQPAAPTLARNLLNESRSSAHSIPELIALTPEETEFIDAVIERAPPSATTFLTVFKAYNDLLQERGVDPQDEVIYYGKLLKLGNVKGKNWGDKWQAVKDQQIGGAPSTSSGLRNPPHRIPTTAPSRAQVLTKLAGALKRVERDDDAFTLHSHQDDTETVATTTPAPDLEQDEPTPYLRTPRFVRRPTSPTPTTNSLRLHTGPPATSATPTPIVQPLARRAVQHGTPVTPPVWDAETSESTTDTPGSTIPPSYGAATRGHDAPQRPSSYTPLRALAKAHLHSKASVKDDGSVSPVVRHAAPASAKEVISKARERRGTVLNEDDAWNKVKMAQDEKAADQFREDRLVERCWEVWKQGYQWISTTNEQIAEARENLVLRLAIHKWRTRTAGHKDLYDRIATLSDNRRLRLALQIWKAKLREKKQTQWRVDMRSRMKLVKDNHERNIVHDVWAKWKQGHQTHLSDQHFTTKLAIRFLTRWRTRLTGLDQLDAAGEHFVSVKESMTMERSWHVWRGAMHMTRTERTMADRVTLRVLSTAMQVWKNRMNQHQVADQVYDVAVLKRSLRSWKTSQDRIRSLERRADKHINRQNDVLVRAVTRVWKAHERGKLLERVMTVRLLKQAWTTWQARIQSQRGLEDMAMAFCTRSSSALASTSVQRWRQVHATHRNANAFAVHYHSAQLSFRMLLMWRLQLRQKLKLTKQARIAEKFFVMRGAFRSWLVKLAERKRERTVKEFERKVLERYFEDWKAIALRQRELKFGEEIVQQRVALRIMSSTLTHWTNTVADHKFRELETAQRFEQGVATAAFKKWKDLCIRHVEELSLMESYQDVKREEHMRRMFYRWLAAARKSRHRRLLLLEREEQLKMTVVASAWDKWRERFQDTRLQPMADNFVLQGQKNLVFRAFGIWHSKSMSLPAVRFHASHTKASVWKIWRNAMPKALQFKQARDMERNSVLSRAFDKWLQAYRTKIALKAVARARYLRLPTAAPRQSTQPIRPVQLPVASSSTTVFPRRIPRPANDGDEGDEPISAAAAARPFRARSGIASLLTSKARSASPERASSPPFKPSMGSSRTKASVTARSRTREAQRQQEGGGTPQQSHEMSSVYTPVRITPDTNGASNGGSSDLLDKGPDPVAADFYTEITAIQDSIQQFNTNVQRISQLQQRSLNNAGDGDQQNNAVLEDLTTQTRDLGNSIKSRIQKIESQPAQSGEDIRMRQNRISFARTKFVESLQNYQQVERDYRAKYKQRVERQFKIVKPDATPEEVNAVVNDVQGGGDQIFAQALTSSTRYGESRAAYREVQDRHEDIRRIERTLEELAQLFNDMSTLVNQQDDSIQNIQTAAGRVEADTEAGLTQTEKAVKSARSARRKRWICFFIFIIILAIIGIAVGVTVGKK